MRKNILALNPGSTSTKIALYDGLELVFVVNLSHSVEELEQLKTIDQQFKFRKEIIVEELAKRSYSVSDIDIIVSRGGLLRPIESGIYSINSKMISDLKESKRQHASNLGALIADELTKDSKNLKAYIADPVVVDEMQEVAKYSGHPEFTRVSVFHALNQKSVARLYAESISKNYEELNLIIAHMGGGISVGAHCKGKVIDVNQALDGEGPFSPERSGTLPSGDLLRAAFSGKYTFEELYKMVVGKGGLSAYTGSNDAYKLELKAMDGDPQAIILYKAMSYQIAKEIGAMSVVLRGKVDQIILTGGMAKSKYLNSLISEQVSFISGISVYPGEDEMRALALNGNLLLSGKITSKEY